MSRVPTLVSKRMVLNTTALHLIRDKHQVEGSVYDSNTLAKLMFEDVGSTESLLDFVFVKWESTVIKIHCGISVTVHVYDFV